MKRALLPWVGPLFVLLLLLIRMQGPEPKPATVAPDGFSAVRAFAVERQILAGIGPHPIGSPANAIVRSRIIGVLQSLGYETQVEDAFACDSHAQCGTVHNVIARLPGIPSRPAVALMCHYDSVPAGPGASDDGVGVATALEIARAFRTVTSHNPLLFVFTDGEEAGLLGAEAFAADHDVPRVAIVVNLDNRGPSGPVLLYETSSNDRRIVSRVLHSLPEPVTTSLFKTIYDLIPHDTDLTVFKRAGRSGVNFASIGELWTYHTPLDALDHVDLRTLQNYGNDAIATVRALANEELHHGVDQNAVWFDVLSLFVISWREHLTVWLSIVLLLASITAAALMIREEETTVLGVIHGAAALLGGIIAAGVIAAALAWLGTLRAHQTWLAHPMPIEIAMWLGGIAATIGVPSTLRRYTTDSGILSGEALIWSLLALVITFTLPGASFLAIAPALILVGRAFIHAFTGLSHESGALISSALISVVFMPIALLMYDGLGNRALPIIAIATAIAFSPVAFAIDERRVAAVALAGAILFALASVALPDTSARRPERVRISYVAEGNLSRWTTGKPTDEMKKIVHFSRFRWPWSGAWSWESPAPHIALPDVQLEVVSDARRAGKRDLTLRLHSQRNAARVTLFFQTSATVESMAINGVVPPPRPAHYYDVTGNGWQRIVVYGGGDATIELVTRGFAPIHAIAIDMTYGVPDAGRAIAAARDRSRAVTSDDGDVTQTVVRKTL